MNEIRDVEEKEIVFEESVASISAEEEQNLDSLIQDRNIKWAQFITVCDKFVSSVERNDFSERMREDVQQLKKLRLSFETTFGYLDDSLVDEEIGRDFDFEKWKEEKENEMQVCRERREMARKGVEEKMLVLLSSTDQVNFYLISLF